MGRRKALGPGRAIPAGSHFLPPPGTSPRASDPARPLRLSRYTPPRSRDSGRPPALAPGPSGLPAGDAAVPSRVGERPPPVSPNPQEGPPTQVETRGSLREPASGRPLAHAQTLPSPSAWSITPKAPEVRGIPVTCVSRQRSPGLGGPRGAGSRILPRTHRVAERGHADPGGPPTSAPLSVNGGGAPPTQKRSWRSGTPNLGQRVWGAWLGREALYGCAECCRVPRPPVALVPRSGLPSAGLKDGPRTRGSRPEGGKRKSQNTPPPGHCPLCLSFSSGNLAPGSKTGVSVRETGLCSQLHACF